MLTLQILMKIKDNQLDPLVNFLKAFSDVTETRIINNKAPFDWDAEIVTKESSDDKYKTTSNELYEKLISDMSRFSDWEYSFINDMYRKATEDETYSDGQKKWIDKLRGKYL